MPSTHGLTLYVCISRFPVDSIDSCAMQLKCYCPGVCWAFATNIQPQRDGIVNAWEIEFGFVFRLATFIFKITQNFFNADIEVFGTCTNSLNKKEGILKHGQSGTKASQIIRDGNVPAPLNLTLTADVGQLKYTSC